MTTQPRLATPTPPPASPQHPGLRLLALVREPLETLARYPGALFVLLGLAISYTVKIYDADRVVQFRFVLAMAAFYLAGAEAEARLGVRGDSPWAPIHRVVLGQVTLLLYFYLRSAIAQLGLPGVTRAELIVVIAALAMSAAYRSRQSQPAPLDPRAPTIPPWLVLLVSTGVWIAWWASTHRFLAYRSGPLQTPSSDPDLHAYFARLVMMGGKIAYTQAPYSSDPQSYPSAFAVLNALWGMISGVSQVKILNCQLTLQACLAVGLVIEAAGTLRRQLGLATALALIGIAHWLFFFPVNQESLVLGGTARFAHSALLLWPLTFALRLVAQSADPGAQPTRLRLLALLAVALGGAWAFVTNPSHVIVILPVLLVTTIAVLTGIKRHETSAPTPRRWIAILLALTLTIPILLTASDALVVWMLRGSGGGAAAAMVNDTDVDGKSQPLSPSAALSAGWRRLKSSTTLGFPDGCISGNKCQLLVKKTRSRWPIPLYLGALGYLGYCVYRWRKRRKAKEPGERTDSLRNGSYVVVGIALGAVLIAFSVGFMDRLMLGQRSMRAILMSQYTGQGLRTLSAYFYFALLAVGASGLALGLGRLAARTWKTLPARWLHVGADVALGLVLLLGVAYEAQRSPKERRATKQAYRTQVKRAPRTSLGWIEPVDIRFAEEVEKRVPHADRVLLPGIAISVSKRERWQFPQQTSRAIVLYSKTPFAFFMSQGPAEFSPAAYNAHVCASLDIPWLAEHRVTWVVMSDGTFQRSCVHNWQQVRDDYYAEVYRLQDRVLYRLRADRIAAAKTDPRLDLPEFAAQGGGPKGEGIRGDVERHGPHLVVGWACDFGSPAPVTIELQLTSRDDMLKTYREFHRAGLQRDARISQACGGSAAHGFSFAPNSVPAGTYVVRVLAYDAVGKESKALAQNFFLDVPL